MALANVLHLFPLDNDVNAAASSNSKNTTNISLQQKIRRYRYKRRGVNDANLLVVAVGYHIGIAVYHGGHSAADLF